MLLKLRMCRMERFLVYGAYRQSLMGWYSFVGFILMDSASGHFSGNVVDPFGDAAIKGNKSADTLVFDKVYSEASDRGIVFTTTDPIRYRLELNKDGVQWDGTYHLRNGENGAAYCCLRPYELTEGDMTSEDFADAAKQLQEFLDSKK